MKKPVTGKLARSEKAAEACNEFVDADRRDCATKRRRWTQQTPYQPKHP